jgi:hypothetical protein
MAIKAHVKMTTRKLTKKEQEAVRAEFTKEAAEEMVDSISAIAKGMKALFATRLSRRAIEILVATHSRVARDSVKDVLDSLEQFEEIWLNKKGKA